MGYTSWPRSSPRAVTDQGDQVRASSLVDDAPDQEREEACYEGDRTTRAPNIQSGAASVYEPSRRSRRRPLTPLAAAAGA